MAKKIGYIEKEGVIYISVKDVFEYLHEVGVITTEEQMGASRWDFEKNILKRLYDCHKSGERTDADLPWIIDREFYCHWLRFEYTVFMEVIKTLRNEREVKRLAMMIDLHDFSRSKLFVKRKFALK